MTSGAALVLHGVKETAGDIDLGCTTALADRFAAAGCRYRVAADQRRIVEIHPSVELIENWWVQQIQWIEGLPVASLADIRRQKLELGRDKDLRDIALIDAFVMDIKC